MPSDGRHDLCRAIGGDTCSLVRLLSRYGPDVRRSLCGQIPPEFRGLLSEDDVMQESYAEAFLSIGQLAPGSSFPAWLRRIARNNLLDAVKGLRAERRGRNHSRAEPEHGDEGVLSLLDVLVDTGTSPSRGAMRGELGEALQRALAQLPDAYRDVVRLYDLECRSAEQVARLTECSPGAVYMRRARALDMLREILGGFSNFA